MQTTLDSVELAQINSATERFGRRRIKVRPWMKYVVAIVLAASWAGFSTWVAIPWADGLAEHAGIILAWVMIFLVALWPGFVVALMGFSLARDHQPPLELQDSV